LPQDYRTMARRVFFVTGTSSGFGRELVEEILSRGDKVVATSRNGADLAFASARPDNFLAVTLDVTNPTSVEDAFGKALSTFGRVDVVTNNAGFGLCGPLEELDDEQIRQQVEVNFFGCVNVTRTAIRVMREQTPCGGLIQQISSMAGQKGMPTFSIYCATKWALAGFTEAVAAEMKPEWRVKTMIVEPGGFR
jgi:NAD(P)-dependent dehydrogenase (short-subunit alcohol dehydrogenase family)